MTSIHPQSSKDTAELARWLWPGGVHLDWDGCVAIRPPHSQGWIPFDPMRNPSDCGLAWPILESRGRIGHLVREMEVQLRKLRCVEHHPAKKPAMGSSPHETTDLQERHPTRRLTAFEMRTWKFIWKKMGETVEDASLLSLLRSVLTLLGIVGFKEQHFPPGTRALGGGTVRAFQLSERCDHSIRLLNLIHKLTPMRGKLVLFGAVMGAHPEDVCGLAGIKEEDLGMELEAGVAEVKAQLLEWHGLTWLGNGLDFCSEEFGLGKGQVPERGSPLQRRRNPVAQDMDEPYALILNGILRRLGGGSNLSRFVSQHLFRLPSRLQRILLLRHLSGFHPAVIGQHLEQSMEQVELELLHGRQLLEEQLLESPTLRPFLAQMVAAMLVVSRDARGEGREERDMGA